SGFVISYVHQSDFFRLNIQNYWRFLKLRLARIYPAHFVATTLLVPLVFARNWLPLYKFTAETRAQYTNFQLVFTMTPPDGWGFPDSVGWNGPSWSVGSEWFAYLLFPVIALVLNRMRSPWSLLGLMLIVLATMIAISIWLNGMLTFMPGPRLTLARVGSEF